MGHHSSLSIANEFLKRGEQEGRELTHMHIQKLVYLAHGWNLAIYNEALIEDTFEAWDFGPVVRKLYDTLKNYGKRPITQLISWGDDTDFTSDDGGRAVADLQEGEIEVIDHVWSAYKHFEAFQLSALTHSDGSPWKNYYSRGENRRIPNEAIGDYFAVIADREH